MSYELTDTHIGSEVGESSQRRQDFSSVRLRSWHEVSDFRVANIGPLESPHHLDTDRRARRHLGDSRSPCDSIVQHEIAVR